MSRLDDFVASCRTRAGKTLTDQLTLSGIKDPAQRASLRAQLRRALAPGGRYRDVAEDGIILPGPDDRGDWVEGLTKKDRNSLPVISESNALSGLRAADKSQLTPRYLEHVDLAQGTNLTGRKGVIVNNALVTGISEYEMLREQIRAERAISAEKDERIRDLQQQLRVMHEVVRGYTGEGGLARAAE